MDKKNTTRLIVLSAIWGSSFIFMRIIAPVLGPILTACLRCLIAGLFLLGVFKLTNYKINWKKDYKELLIIGVLNSAVPFTMFSYAAINIPASLSTVLNSTTPMIGAILASTFAIEPLSLKKSIGLVVGSIGVAIISSVNLVGSSPSYFLSIGACLIATTCYGINGVYVKLKASHIEPKAIAAGSQLFAGLVLVPLTFFTPVSINFTFELVLTVVAFAVICSAIAYLLFFELIRNVGPTKTLTVTFLVPIFGITWATLLLKEPITFPFVMGGLIILMGTYFVTSS